ncbi:MAG: hypothetical protein EOO19_14165, partial [Chryseobacterium sp.]
MGKKFVYDKGPDIKTGEGRNITYSVFFDGTQNNKTNTEAGKERRDKIEKQGNENYLRRFQFLAEENEEPTPERSIPSNEPVYVTPESNLEEVVITSYTEKGDSYENDYTNIARLWKSYKEIGGVQEPIYIEGVGTEDNKEDDMAAVGTGVFSTSVRAKARKACTDIITRLDKLLRPIRNKEDKFINTLTIDVYGFSRGATTARYFTHFVTCTDTEQEKSKNYENHDISKEVMPIIDHIKESCNKNFKFWDNDSLSKWEKTKMLTSAIVKTEVELIIAAAELYSVVNNAYEEELHDYFQQQLKRAGIIVNHVDVRFLGLFDTVSSYGLFHDNDVRDLSLDAVNKAQKVMHLAAADEYRKNFALTN